MMNARVGAIIAHMIAMSSRVESVKFSALRCSITGLTTCASISGKKMNFISTKRSVLGCMCASCPASQIKRGSVIVLIMWLRAVMLSASTGFPWQSVQMNTTETPAGTAVAMMRPAKISGARKGFARKARSGVIKSVMRTMM